MLGEKSFENPSDDEAAFLRFGGFRRGQPRLERDVNPREVVLKPSVGSKDRRLRSADFAHNRVSECVLLLK